MEAHINKLVYLLLICTFIAFKVNSEELALSSSSPQSYVSEILSLIKKYAITKNQVDMEKLTFKVNELSKDAKTIEDTYPAIKLAFKLLKTNHTFLHTKNGELAAYYSDIKCNESINNSIPKLNNIGYIRVNRFSSKDPWDKEIFAFALQQKISEQDSEKLLGWIVDLRWNLGGNMWPMIAGIGPLLGNGTYGYFINENENSWGYQNGASVYNGDPVVSIKSPYKLLNPNPKIAVLSSQNVASSGEATLISFKERENVKIFGSNTCGQSTSNRSFILSDESRLYLTVSSMADKNKNRYGGVVTVDELTPQHKVIDAAVEWLNQQHITTNNNKNKLNNDMSF